MALFLVILLGFWYSLISALIVCVFLQVVFVPNITTTALTVHLLLFLFLFLLLLLLLLLLLRISCNSLLHFLPPAVTVNSLHPGLVQTELFDSINFSFGSFITHFLLAFSSKVRHSNTQILLTGKLPIKWVSNMVLTVFLVWRENIAWTNQETSGYHRGYEVMPY